MGAAMLALGAVSCLLALHPFTSYPLSLHLLLWVLHERRILADLPARRPSIAVCTCAYNEERNIAAKIQNLIALRAGIPDLEILVYVDAASDRTADIARKYDQEINLQIGQERLGKTHGMNLLVGLTSAEIVVFTDANVMLDPLAIVRLIPYFSDPQVGCVCGHLNYTNEGESVTSSTGSLYWRLEESIKRMETRLGSTMGADGSLFAIRRALHHAPPDHIIDDMYVSFHVLCDGYRVIQVSDVEAYEESVPVATEEFRRKIRIACQAFNVHRMIWPQILRLDMLSRYMYLSHKLIRWFSIYLLAAGVALFCGGFALEGRFAEAFAVVLVPAVVLALGFLWAIPPFSQIADLVSALLGTGIGVWRSLRGEVYQTWKPAASLRK